MTTYVTHYKVVVGEADGEYSVDAVTKEYRSTGPDIGRVVDRETLLANVSREYAEMLARELTKREHEWGCGDRNTFDIALAVGRNVHMWTGENSEWGERIESPIVY